MGQDKSGTNLATTTVASKAEPTCRVLCDWDEAGFGSVGSWTDESAHVRSLRGDAQAVNWRRSPAAIGCGVADVVYVTLDNPECTTPYSGRRFSPSNANGALYSKIGDGDIAMKRCIVEMGYYDGATPERLRQITGYIVDCPENYGAKTVELEVRDRGADCVNTRRSTALYTGTTAKAYLETLVALLGKDAVSGGDQVFDEGLVILPYAWLDDDDIWKEIHRVAEAQGGRFSFDKDGDLHFHDGAHFVQPQTDSWDDPTQSQFTFSVDDFRTCNPRYDPDTVFNHIVVQYYPRYVAVSQTIYNSSEVIVVPPGETTTVTAEFRYPVSSISTPEEETDYVAVNAGGTDISSDISINMTSYATQAELEITNGNSDYAAYLVKLELRGTPVISVQANKYEVSDATSITARGRRTLPVSSPYVQSYRQAQMLGDFLLSRFKDPVQIITLGGVRGVPWLEVGDRVTVQETGNLGINEDYFIARSQWSCWPGPYQMTLTLMRAADLYPISDYFLLGTSKYGTGAGHGHLFW